jgi:hypothetical protein
VSEMERGNVHELLVVLTAWGSMSEYRRVTQLDAA